MGGMPADIAKGRFLSALDDVMNTKRAEVLSALMTSSDDLATIFERFAGNVLAPEDYKHLRVDWGFGASGSDGRWWPGTNAQRIVRAGLINALQNAGALPIDVIWLCPGGDSVQVATYANARQVAINILTPPVPDASFALDYQRTYEEKDNLWVTGPTRNVLDPQDLSRARPGLVLEEAGDEVVRTVRVLSEGKPTLQYP